MSNPHFITLLAHDPYRSRKNFLDSIIYEPEYHLTHGTNDCVIRAMMELFDIRDNKSFRALDEIPRYPSLIRIKYNGNYYGAIILLSNDQIFYVDYNDKRDIRYLFFSLSEVETYEWIEKLKNPTVDQIKEFFIITSVQNEEVKMEISPINKIHTNKQLLKLIKKKHDLVMGYIINHPKAIYRMNLDCNAISDNIIRNLYYLQTRSHEDPILLQIQIRRQMERRLLDLESKLMICEDERDKYHIPSYQEIRADK